MQLRGAVARVTTCTVFLMHARPKAIQSRAGGGCNKTCETTGHGASRPQRDRAAVAGRMTMRRTQHTRPEHDQTKQPTLSPHTQAFHVLSIRLPTQKTNLRRCDCHCCARTTPACILPCYCTTVTIPQQECANTRHKMLPPHRLALQTRQRRERQGQDKRHGTGKNCSTLTRMRPSEMGLYNKTGCREHTAPLPAIQHRWKGDKAARGPVREE